jgi:mRNA-degrading endonuclease toxin of MazEF toxin-antitoxin module
VADVLQGAVYYWPALPAGHPMGIKPHMWVVVSSAVFNETHNHVMACPLTSYPATAIDVHVPDTPHDPLSHDSALRVCMMTPILKRHLTDPVGRLPFKIVQQVTERLRISVEAR